MSVLSRFRAVAAAGLAIAVFAAPASAQFRIIITEPETPLVPNSVMELADQLGYFEREGVDVEFIRVGDTTIATQALQAGAGEMANISLEAALVIAARDVFEMRGVITPDKFLPFLIAAKNSITSPAQLAGSSFGVASVGSLDYTLSSRVLTSVGVNPASVNFVAVGPPAQRGTALVAGQIDATTMSVGVFLGIPDRSGIHILLDVDDYKNNGGGVLNKINVVPVSVLETRRDEVKAVVTALIKAARDFNADPNVWIEAMVTARPTVPRANLEILGANFQGTWSSNGGLDVPHINFAVGETYAGAALQGAPMVTLDEWLDLSIVDEVLAELGIDDSGNDPAGR